MSMLTDKLCLDAAKVASSPALKLLIMAKTLLALMGAIRVVFLFRKKGCGWLPNPNGKVLYCSHVYFSLHSAIFFTIIYIFDLIRTSIPSDDPCFYVLSARFSCFIRLIPVVAVVSQSFNMFAFAVERAVSTIFPRDYERVTAPYFGIILITLSIAAAFSLDLNFIYFPIQENSYVATITTRNIQNNSTFQIAVCIPLFFEITTITIFGLTYLLNLWKSHQYNQNPARLSDRYQIAENKKVISALFPCFVIHFILSAVTYGGLVLYPTIFSKYDPLTLSIWVECVANSQIYALCMSSILMCRTRRSYKVSAYDAEAATRAHFKKLNEIFNA